MGPPKSDSQLELGYATPRQSDSGVEHTHTRRNSWPVFVTRPDKTTRTTATNTIKTMADKSTKTRSPRAARDSEDPSVVEQMGVSSNSSVWGTSGSSSFYRDYSMNTSLDVDILDLSKSAVFGEERGREGCVDGVCIESMESCASFAVCLSTSYS